MFVHDFVVVHRSPREVVAELESIEESTLGALVLAAWTANRDDWLRLGCHVPLIHELAGPTVHLGPATERPDATVVAISWVGDELLAHCPDVQGDLEIADGGERQTQLHLLATYLLKEVDDAWTTRTAPAHRAQSVALRNFLSMLGELLESGCSLRIRSGAHETIGTPPLTRST